MDVTTIPQFFRQAGYNTTGAGKMFHPGTPSGGLSSSEGGGDQCPLQSQNGDCRARPGLDEPGSWSEPYFFCDQYTNDTVQNPAMQEWACAQHGSPRRAGSVAEWPSCGTGCVQSDACIACFTSCGTWGEPGAYAACDCPAACYPEGLIAEQTIRVLRDKAEHPEAAPWFHAVGLKRPHLSYRAPRTYFEMYDLEQISLPYHRSPPPSAPSISYAHTCIGGPYPASANATPAAAEAVGMGGTVYTDSAASACVRSQLNRTSPFNHTFHSAVETITNATIVRQLRRAYYATISFTDAAVGRVLDEHDLLNLTSTTIIALVSGKGIKKAWHTTLATRTPPHSC